MTFHSPNDRLRGHQLLTQELARRIPRPYATDGQGSQAIAHAKLFTPDSSWSWYILEYDPATHLCFGWAINDAAPECAELGDFSLDELDQARGPLGLPVERDLAFEPKTLAEVKSSHQSR